MPDQSFPQQPPSPLLSPLSSLQLHLSLALTLVLHLDRFSSLAGSLLSLGRFKRTSPPFGIRVHQHLHPCHRHLDCTILLRLTRTMKLDPCHPAHSFSHFDGPNLPRKTRWIQFHFISMHLDLLANNKHLRVPQTSRLHRSCIFISIPCLSTHASSAGYCAKSSPSNFIATSSFSHQPFPQPLAEYSYKLVAEIIARAYYSNIRVPAKKQDVQESYHRRRRQLKFRKLQRQHQPCSRRKICTHWQAPVLVHRTRIPRRMPSPPF